MGATGPRLTIGLPVYNGENYLAESIDALLAQSYTDFELVISDNASTDGTEKICRDYADSDGRIRYLKQPRNIGAAPNHNFLIDQARGELFKWAAHDDLFAPDLVERCVATLDANPDAVLAHSYMAIIDPDGKTIEEYDYRLATDSPSAPERFHSLLVTEGGDDFYGVIRTDALRRMTPHDSYHNAGRKFIAELSLYGRFLQVPEVMFFRREHPGRGDNLGTIAKVCGNLDPRRKGQPTARLLAEYLVGIFAAVSRAPLSAGDRRRCYGHLVRWLAGKPLGKIGVRL
ncbi:MAG TPA: glycosyltransferase [Amycolatopsis sp.]|nr:glycosyltransferase [Amycolatopsis sp.]